MIHLHWDFIAYVKLNENKSFDQSVFVSVKGHKTEQVALEAAKNIIKRPHYYLQKVWECITCGFQEDMLKEFRKMHD